jgi:hypothetical protein
MNAVPGSGGVVVPKHFVICSAPLAAGDDLFGGSEFLELSDPVLVHQCEPRGERRSWFGVEKDGKSASGDKEFRYASKAPLDDLLDRTGEDERR